jgi:predicted hydrocarbon binding protein
MKISRKEFFSRIWKLILGVGAALSFEGSRLVFSATNRDGQEDPMTQKSKFIHDWISNLIENMDEHLDEAAKINLLEKCGRACAESHAKEQALKNKGDLSGWLSVLKRWVGSENVRKEEHGVRVMYSKCLCPLVQGHPPLMSKTYCNCSRGWLMETFETVLEKPVEVKLEDSIMQGGKRCRFIVLFEA